MVIIISNTILKMFVFLYASELLVFFANNIGIEQGELK